MKRTLALLLALSLMLAACSGPSVPEPTEAPVSATVPIPVPTQPTAKPTTEPITLPTAEPTTEPPTVPTEPAPPETEPSAPETTEPGPGQTTWQVYTDWSAYAPYAGSGARYTRLRPGALDHFEPSEDYGMVFPYVAAQQIVDWMYTGWDWLEAHYTYGFADRNGRLLTDGIYYRVYLTSTGDPEPRYYWKVSQLIDGKSFRTRFPGVEYDFWDAELPEVYGLISLDGSVVLDCAYPGLVRNGNGFCRDNGGGRFDFTMLDADLEPLFTGEDVFAGVSCEWWSIEYGEGLYLVQTADKQEYEEAVGEYELVNRSSWYCDETGSRVLGPYTDASTFHEGLACVSTDGEHYGYIDKTGAWVIQPVYSGNWWESVFQDGRAIQYSEDRGQFVLDRSGTELLHRKQGYFDRADCGFLLEYYLRVDDTSYTYKEYYDPDGTLLASGGEHLQNLDSGTFADYDAAAHTVRIFTPERTLLTLEKKLEGRGELLEKGVYLRDGYLLMGWYVGSRHKDETRLFVTADFSDINEVPWVEEPSLKYGDDYGYDPGYPSHDEITGKDWYFCWTGTAWEGRTEGGSRITVPLRSARPTVVGDMVCAHTDRASYLLNHNGEILFCFPIDAGD